VILLVQLESSWQGGVPGLFFVAFGPLMQKLLNFKDFYELKNIIELYYFLFWKNHNFCIWCPNPTKQRPLHSFLHKASIHANFMAFEPLV